MTRLDDYRELFQATQTQLLELKEGL